MRYIFKFPDIGEGLDEGTILQWYVTKGQEIKSGQSIVKMETDKVVADIPSPKSGIIIANFGNVGETIHVGAPLVEIEIEGVFGADAVAEAKSSVKVEAIEEGSAGVVGTIEVAANNAFMPASDEGFTTPKAETKTGHKILATPVARALAKELGIDINMVVGTGPAGRVTKTDIQTHQAKNQEKPAPMPMPPKITASQ